MSHLQDVAMQAAETIQTASIKHHPNFDEDRAPSTAADSKQAVTIDRNADIDGLSDVDEDEIPVSMLQPPRRRPQMPPLPDLRFEQSYLASIKDTKGWQGVAYITLRDQLLMPLVQGVAWTLAVAGWKHWNRAAQLSGQSVGARVRRWWWGVNNWKLPEEAGVRNEKLAEDVSEYYKGTANTGFD